MSEKTYPLGEVYQWRHKFRAVKTGEFRKPKKGEWYLSGAIPEAYQAINDYDQEYYIARIVVRNE